VATTLKPHGLKASVDYNKDSRRMLASIPTECIDLVYLDQPFFSSWIHQGSWADLNSADVRWGGGVHDYFDWMAAPLADMHRVLKPSGGLFLICDEAVGLYIRLLLDEIFEKGSTLSQKILCETDCGPAHHSIFYYRKSTQNTPRQGNSYSVIRREGDKDCAIVAFSFLGRRLVRRNP
jgi:hypothetical protein